MSISPDPIPVDTRALMVFAELLSARRSYMEDTLDRALEHVVEAARDAATAIQVEQQK